MLAVLAVPAQYMCTSVQQCIDVPCRSEVGFAGRPNSDEFDFLSMPWNRFNQSKGSKDLPGTPGTEGMLHRGRDAAVASRAASPFRGGIDAEAVSRQSAVTCTGTAIAGSERTVGDDPTVPYPRPNAIPGIPSRSTNIDLSPSEGYQRGDYMYSPPDQHRPVSFLPPAPAPAPAPEDFVFPFELSPDGLAQQNRWVDLNYGFGFGIDIEPIDPGWISVVEQGVSGGDHFLAPGPGQQTGTGGQQGETREFTDLFDWPSA